MMLRSSSSTRDLIAAQNVGDELAADVRGEAPDNVRAAHEDDRGVVRVVVPVLVLEERGEGHGEALGDLVGVGRQRALRQVACGEGKGGGGRWDGMGWGVEAAAAAPPRLCLSFLAHT